MEVWKTIPGFYDLYEVSNHGRARRGERILKGSLDSKGYYQIDMTHKGDRKQMFIHRAVAICFLDNPEDKPQVNHINGIKTDNRLENLEWTTCKENMLHAQQSGLNKKEYKKIEVYNPEGKLQYFIRGLKMVESLGFSKSSVGKYLRGVIKKKPKGYHFVEV